MKEVENGIKGALEQGFIEIVPGSSTDNPNYRLTEKGEQFNRANCSRTIARREMNGHMDISEYVQSSLEEIAEKRPPNLTECRHATAEECDHFIVSDEVAKDIRRKQGNP